MLIKSADDRSEELAELNALLLEPHLTPAQKKRIREQLDNMEKGAWGEHRAAYFIDFHFAGSQNNIVLHDLRLALSDGRTAQIDHLIINRMLFIYVLETKNWNQLMVDESGVCTTRAGRIGVESPLEQCKRHAEVLAAVLSGHPQLNALALHHEIISKVLVAPSCNLQAPHHKEWYLKADHFHAAWEKQFDDTNLIKAVVGFTYRIEIETLVKLGQELASLHQPGRTDWRARFRIPPVAVELKPPANKLVSSIEGLSEYVPKWGADWFVLLREPTEVTMKKIKAAGYRAKKENGEWVWRLKA